MLLNKLLNVIKGSIIGLATLVPGVSGGTMAIVLGIYDELIHALGRPQHWKRSAGFLFQVGAGALAGALLFSRLIALALKHFGFPTRFFFIGLICGGLPVLYRRTKSSISRKSDFLYLLAGLLLVMSMAVKPGALIHITGTGGIASFLLLILAGCFIAIALILPGISASFMLLALGLYEVTLNAVHAVNLAFLLPVVLGCILGVLTTTRVLEGILQKYPRKSYLVIVGFLLGSILQVFPGIPPGFSLLYCLAALILGYLIIQRLSAC